MSKQSFTSALNETIKSLHAEVQNRGVDYPDRVISGTFSMENAGTFESEGKLATQDLARTIAEAMDTLGCGFDGEVSIENSEPLRAGVIAALASTRPAEYHRAALTSKSKDSLSLESIYAGLGGEIDVAGIDAYSQEAFDSTELANFAAQNIVFNVMAARQDAFAEAWFPTKVVTAAEGGIGITVDRQEVIIPGKHATDGTPLDLKRRNLNDAFYDHTVLNRPSTELVPFARPDNSADGNFVPASLVATRNLEIDGTSIPTRPLLIGKKLNLLGLSQHPGLLENGTLDQTDQVAAGMKLKAIYVVINDASDTEVFKFVTGHLPRNQFKKSHEGEGREVVLNFISDTLVFDGNVKTVGGAETALLKTEVVDANLVVSLGLSITGNDNVGNGDLQVNTSGIRVESVVNAAGESIALDAGAGQAIVDAFESLNARVVGYELDARRSNSNWRSTGSLIDVNPYTETYAIEPGYPISVLTPPTEESNGSKINGMVNAARIRNSNNAVTTLLNYAEQLEAVTEALARGVKVDVVGAGRHIVKPFFQSESIDLQAKVISLSSKFRAEDVSKVLVDAIRDMAYRMFREGNYGPALSNSNAGVDVKPILLIGCDEVVKRHLDVVADQRVLGEYMDFRVVSTNDNRMTDKIFLSFTRERPGSEDGLSFGVHAYVPELIQRLNVSRGNGSTAKNDRIIPRSIHVPVLPILARLDVENLREALLNG